MRLYTSKRIPRAWPIVSYAVLAMMMCQPGAANVLCVSAHGAGGCYPTITAAVMAASAGDTIEVGPGTYKEGVVITMPLSLIGANQNSTVIDASAQPNGIFINGLAAPGLAHVTISGFTVENAKFEGILVLKASFVTIFQNQVIKNDQSLQPDVPTCPGLPAYDPDGNDCGEGLHLLGADHSIVANNLVTQNAGGILLTDEMAETHDNVITGNVVTENPFDCGITLASHHQATMSGATSPFGVHHNRIEGNTVSKNGVNFGGAGIGIFASAPGTKDFGNTVINNVATGNGLPGVAMHGHAPNQNLNDNVIVGNRLSDNGADDDTGTSTPTGISVFSVSPVSGIILAENVIDRENIDVVVKTSATSEVNVHLNNLLGDQYGVENLGSGPVNATMNWWKCSGGPTAPGCVTISGPNIVYAPWLTQPF